MSVTTVLASCVGKPQPVLTTPQGKYQLGRVACREFRYSDIGRCESEALAFYKGSYPGTTKEVLTKVSTSPLVYSMKAKREEVEVRFALVTPAELVQYGDSVNYYEIKTTIGHSEKEDINFAADEFKVKPDDILMSAFQDNLKIDKKDPWRGLLKRKKVMPPYPVVGDEEEYGIVINPPYPR